MSLVHHVSHTLTQLQEAIQPLEAASYIMPLEVLSGSGIGPHVRHVIEFYQCLQEGYALGSVDYDKRQRNLLIESSPRYAAECIEALRTFIELVDLKKKLTLYVSYHQEDVSECYALETTMERELVYNIEHSIHHMALIKIGFQALGLEMSNKEQFGVAGSTLKYRQSQACAQ